MDIVFKVGESEDVNRISMGARLIAVLVFFPALLFPDVWILKILLLTGVVFLFYIPSILLSIVYNVAGGIVYLLNTVICFITGRKNEEFDRYLINLINYNMKVSLGLSGMIDQYPHIDIYGREKDAMPFVVMVRSENSVSRLWSLLRITGMVFIIMIPWTVLLILSNIVFGFLSLAHWGILAATGGANEPIFRLMEKILRFQVRVSAFALGLTNQLPPFHGGELTEEEIRFDFSDREDSSTFAQTPDDFYNVQQSSGLEMNLVVYTLLLILSMGLYSFLWLIRISKKMGHDPFSIVAMSLIIPLLPLSVVFSRYYRKAEKIIKNEPSPFLEILVIIPVVNLIFGPLIIQLILNEYDRAKRIQDSKY